MKKIDTIQRFMPTVYIGRINPILWKISVAHWKRSRTHQLFILTIVFFSQIRSLFIYFEYIFFLITNKKTFDVNDKRFLWSTFSIWNQNQRLYYRIECSSFILWYLIIIIHIWYWFRFNIQIIHQLTRQTSQITTISYKFFKTSIIQLFSFSIL
jgi:hypothetical protein